MERKRMIRLLVAAVLAVGVIAGGALWFSHASRPTALPGTGSPLRDAPEAGVDVADLGGEHDLLLQLRKSPPANVASAGTATGTHRTAQDAPVEEAGWKDLQQRADAGDVRSACRLSLTLSACREAHAERQRIDREVAQLAASADADKDRIALLAADEERVSTLEQRCGGAPDALVRRDWEYLLDAARQGHGPSMWRFVLDPPIDHTRPLAYADALVAYRDYTLGLVDALIERRSAEGLVMALLLTAGIPIIGDDPLYPRDAEATLRAAAAVAEVRGQPLVLERTIERTRDELDPALAQRVVEEGRRMAADFTFQFSTIGNGIEVDDTPAGCDAHWGN
jgi:hypothetical protein